MSHRIRLVSAFFVLALGLAASRPGVAAAAPPLPFQASGPEWVTWEGPHPDCGPGRLKVAVAGWGQATHLGRYAIARQHCINLATFTIEDGTFEQTAANGDRLWGTYTGSTEAVLEFAPDGSPLVIVITSPTQITGGTGRFAQASGAGTTRGIFNVASQAGTFTFDGEITYRAASSAGR
jgi:hypothetical protein